MSAEHPNLFVDIDPDTDNRITEDADMGPWTPVEDEHGILMLPVRSSMGQTLKAKLLAHPNIKDMSREELQAYFENLTTSNPLAGRMDVAEHLSDLPENVRPIVFARVRAALGLTQ